MSSDLPNDGGARSEHADPRVVASVAALLNADQTEAWTWTSLSGGRNHRVYRVATRDGAEYCCKWFFSEIAPTGGVRDRLAAELVFSQWAERCGASVPRALGSDADARVVLFEFVRGDRLEPPQIDADAMRQAIAFLRHLQTPLVGLELPIASEACFSLAEHFRCVADRTARFLAEVEADASPAHRQAVALMQQRVQPFVARWAATVQGEADSASGAWSDSLPDSLRIVSPSDFGFHNALRTPSGKLVFHDFEHAGWDDPAKTICDFLCQPDLPLPKPLHAAFVEESVAWMPDTNNVRRRIDWLLPLYRAKWCCILLNEFLESEAARRTFSSSRPLDLEAQLARAELMAARLEP